jgi:hypothetical protein
MTPITTFPRLSEIRNSDLLITLNDGLTRAITGRSAKELAADVVRLRRVWHAYGEASPPVLDSLRNAWLRP